jgi:hypothetical protein
MCNQLGIIRGQAPNDSNTPIPEHGISGNLAQDSRKPADLQDMDLGLDSLPTFPEQPLHWIEEMSLNDMISGQDSHDLYALYYNDNLTLNGAIEADWEALEREIFRHM